MARKSKNSDAEFAPGAPRWWKHPNYLPDGTISSYSYRVAWYDGGKRFRQNFASQGEAEAHVQALTKQALEHEHGLRTQVTDLTLAQLESAKIAYAILAREGYFDPKEPDSAQCLWQAAEWFTENYEKLSVQVKTFSEAIPLFIKTRSGKSPRTTKSHQGYLDEFAEKHGKYPVSAITPKMIEEYLDSVKAGNVAKLHRWDTLHAFFEFCAGKKNTEGQWIGRNPVKQVPEPRYNPGVIHIYSLPEITKLIQTSLDTGYAPNLVVRLFSMIREVEMEAMVNNGGSIWQFANLETRQIRLTAREVKTQSDKSRGGRNVDILPVLVKWLIWFKKRGWDIFENRSVYENVRRKVDPSKIGRESGYVNLVRHSAISYRMPIETSIFHVADQAGTSEPVIRRSYLKRVSINDAKCFFSLTPDKFSWPESQPTPKIRKIVQSGMPSQL